jgi:hypoxanthine phosphoribosyltransferase
MGIITWVAQRTLGLAIRQGLGWPQRAAAFAKKVEPLNMSDRPSTTEIERVRHDAELIYSRTDVEAALDRMAAEIGARIGDRDPLLLAVMIGGLSPLGALLPRLQFPLQVDYVHATRYRGETTGGQLAWMHKPGMSLKDRTVLIVDDVLDHGITLAAIVDDCRAAGAREVLTAVLVTKNMPNRTELKEADFCGLRADDRYLFGWGMDYRSYLRNADGIYAARI